MNVVVPEWSLVFFVLSSPSQRPTSHSHVGLQVHLQANLEDQRIGFLQPLA